MLHPTTALGLSNDKYLEIDISKLNEDDTVTVYGIENANVDNDFAMRYNKFYCAVGELQKQFTVGDNEDLIIDPKKISEIQLNYFNGSNVVYTPYELQALARMRNDITSLAHDMVKFGEASDNEYACFGFRTFVTVPLDGVRDFEIKRTNSTESVEFYLLDAAPSALSNTTPSTSASVTEVTK